ncbi:hypothetical protein [Massilia phosphatilytica]
MARAGAARLCRPWTATILHAGAERRRAEEQAFKEADAYAEAYEQYVTRSVAQIDQITMQLKHSWEHAHDRSLIENMRRDGMFTDAAFVNVSVIGPDGAIRSSSRIHERGLNLSRAGFFIQHRDAISTALRIGTPPPELEETRGTILFTRRLDTLDDGFDGVLLMAVDAGYFTSFVSSPTLGPGSLLALVGTENALRVEQDARGIVRTQSASSLLPANADRWPVARGVQLGRGAGRLCRRRGARAGLAPFQRVSARGPRRAVAYGRAGSGRRLLDRQPQPHGAGDRRAVAAGAGREHAVAAGGRAGGRAGRDPARLPHGHRERQRRLLHGRAGARPQGPDDRLPHRRLQRARRLFLWRHAHATRRQPDLRPPSRYLVRRPVRQLPHGHGRRLPPGRPAHARQ